jgi:hypothetical protein
VRVRVLEWGSSVLSAQTTLRGALAGRTARPFADTSRFVQIDARLLWGHGFEIFGFHAFTDVEIAFRSDGGFGPQARIDTTAGLWPTDSLLLLFQSFTVVTPGRFGHAAYLSRKLQASAVYWVTPSVGLQVGSVLALRGINSGAERGGFTALWYRF